MMKKLFPYLIALLIIALLVVFKVLFFSGEAKDDKNKAKGKAPAVPVTAVVMQKEKLNNEIYITGHVLAGEMVDLIPESSGKITHIYFLEGASVSKGTLLVKINDAELQAQRKKLELKIRNTEEKEGRQKELFKIGGISQEQYDATVTEMNALKADLELVNAQIAKTEIRAPFNGTIGFRRVSEGSYVSQTTHVASIQQTDPLKLDFYIPEKYASLVSVNDSLYYTTVSSDEIFGAKVLATEPRIDELTKTLQIRAATRSYAGKVLPGASARIHVSLGADEDALMVPTEAVIPILKGQKVFICRNGLAEEKNIKTGFRSDTEVQVLEGLQVGDTVIVTGIMQLKTGTPLNVTSVK
jgi:membrane fusion protein, multidrug efflux system